MSPFADRTGHSRFHSGLFDAYLKRLKKASANPRPRAASDPKRVSQWMSTWSNAYDRQFDVRRPDLLQFGMLLGRFAETHSQHIVAEVVLDRLADSAAQGESWISSPASVLITAGEYNRRRGNLDRAESRYNEARSLLERDLAQVDSRPPIHRELGRVFYELGYLERLRGNAEATRSTFERSEAECDLANDELGAEIARTVLALVSYEEGFAATAIGGLTESLARLKKLANDPKIKEAGRDALARRWVSNSQYHLVQAHLAGGNTPIARRLIVKLGNEQGPSITGLVTAKRIEAQLFLAEGDLGLASDAIGASWEAIEQQGDLMSTELAAATVAFAGVTHALEGSSESALSCFEQACSLPADLHNRRAQGWAWAGRAILAKEAGDRVTSLAAVHEGLTVVQRCGAPIRAFLMELLRSGCSTEGGPVLDDLKALVCRS